MTNCPTRGNKACNCSFEYNQRVSLAFSEFCSVFPSRPAHSNSQYGGPTNTFMVRPGARQPISYIYQSNHR